MDKVQGEDEVPAQATRLLAREKERRFNTLAVARLPSLMVK